MKTENESNNKFPTGLVIMIVSVSIIGAITIGMGVILLDSEADRAKCSSEFHRVANTTDVQAFANDDFWVLNLGANIHCDVFWMDRYCLTDTKFLSNTLSEEKLNASRFC